MNMLLLKLRMKRKNRRRNPVSSYLLQLREKPTVGTVIAIAEDVDKEDFPFKEGDQVLFEKYSGNTVKYNDEEYLIMKAKDIVAIVE